MLAARKLSAASLPWHRNKDKDDQLRVERFSGKQENFERLNMLIKLV